MKTNGRHEEVAQIARKGLMLTALLAVALSAATAGRAQSAVSASATANAATTATVPAPPTQATVMTKKKKSEGIQVRGYWKIDVRDPDGTLRQHTEFENALTTNAPNQNSGDFALSSMLSGQSAAINCTPSVAASPISSTSIDTFVQQFGQQSATISSSNCFVTVYANYLSIGLNTTTVAQKGVDSVTTLPSGPCTVGFSQGVGCVIPTSEQVINGNQIQLSGSVLSTAAATVTITQVATYVSTVQFTVGDSLFVFQVNQLGSVTAPDQVLSAAYSFTSASLAAAGSCGGANQSPCQVQVAPNQSVSVTVLISFS
jgi:hypothetical protein